MIQVYNAQNKALHKGFALMGAPYNEDKAFWLPLIQKAAKGRKVKGLSDLTLGERWQLIKSMQKQGAHIHNPGIRKALWHWKKGDPEVVAAEPDAPTVGKRPIRVPKAKQAMVKKIGAILAAQKKPWAYADRIAKDKFGVDFVEFLEIENLEKVMQMLIIHNRRRGGE